MPDPEHLIQPLEHTPGALVENVYATPGTLSLPDHESQDTMGEYLMERLEPPEGPQTRVILQETGKTMPGVTREIVGWKETKHFERQGWLISPRVAAAIMVGTAICSVIKPAVLDARDEVLAVDHQIYRYFNPLHPVVVEHDKAIPVTGPIRHVRVDAAAANAAGSATVDKVAISEFSNKVARVVRKGGEIISVTIVGKSSDDYGTNESIGRPESKAQDFADNRAAAYAAAIRRVDLATAPKLRAELRDSKIIQKVDQSVLTPAQKKEVFRAAEAAGFTGTNNIIDAINSVQAGQQEPAKLRWLVTKLFTSRRGVTIDAAVSMPGKKSTEIVHVKTSVLPEDNPPSDPKRDYDFWFVPMIPIPRLRRVTDGLKAMKRFHLTPRRPIMTPSILREEKDQVWLRIRPEAVQEDGTLVNNPWAFTRKFEYLMRDDRIKDVLRVDFMNQEEQKKSLRIMFVDHSPAQETIDEFSELLRRFTAMQDGKLADRVSGIFVYPSENAGTGHRDPKRVAMGVDQQSPASMLGTYTYALDLVELHMPATWDPKELQAMFTSFYGPNWTLVHEVGGHGTDDSDQPLHLRRILARGIPQAHVIDGDPRARRMEPLRSILRHLPLRPQDKHEPVQFDITYSVPDLDGELVSLTARVFEDDPRLAHAITSTIVGHEPTRYAGENVSEHYAETAAATTTGIPIPYDEAHVAVRSLTRDNGDSARFAEGYYPDKRAQDLFRTSVGADGDSLPATFMEGPETMVSHIAPEYDPLIREHTQRTRLLATLRPEQMIAILARVTQRNRKEPEA